MKHQLHFNFPDRTYRRAVERLLKANAGERGKVWSMSKPKVNGTTFTVYIDDTEAAVMLKLTYSEYILGRKP